MEDGWEEDERLELDLNSGIAVKVEEGVGRFSAPFGDSCAGAVREAMTLHFWFGKLSDQIVMPCPQGGLTGGSELRGGEFRPGRGYGPEVPVGCQVVY